MKVCAWLRPAVLTERSLSFTMLSVCWLDRDMVCLDDAVGLICVHVYHS